MQYITSKEDQKMEEKGGIDKLKGLGDKNLVKCRTCNGGHRTAKCLWKDTVLGDNNKKLEGEKLSGFPGSSAGGDSSKGKDGPPNMREGAANRSDNPNNQRCDTFAIRISNLSESTTRMNLEELVRQFGPIQKLFLAKDEVTAACKGFAYVHYKFRGDAVKAITYLIGHGYNVVWRFK